MLVEQLGTLCRHRDQPLSLADVLHNDLTNVGAQLFSRQLELLVCLQLLLSDLGESVDFLPTLLSFPFNFCFFSGALTNLVRYICLFTHLIIIFSIFHSFVDSLRLRGFWSNLFMVFWHRWAQPLNFLFFFLCFGPQYALSCVLLLLVGLSGVLWVRGDQLRVRRWPAYFLIISLPRGLEQERATSLFLYLLRAELRVVVVVGNRGQSWLLKEWKKAFISYSHGCVIAIQAAFCNIVDFVVRFNFTQIWTSMFIL